MPSRKARATTPAPSPSLQDPHIREREFTLVLAELQDHRRLLHVILRAVAALHHQGEEIIMISQELQDALGKIDTATTAIGTEIKNLTDELKNAETPEEQASVVARINAQADKLTAIAADPANPVPPLATTDGPVDSTRGSSASSGQ